MAWLIGLRDLQWGRRRFAIGVVATALVFALGLLMSGVSASFDNEIDRTVGSFGADGWVVRARQLRPVHRAGNHAVRRAPRRCGSCPACAAPTPWPCCARPPTLPNGPTST